MGTNLRGLLGLGRILINTGGNSHPIVFPKNEKIIDFKVGKSHALALTEDGKVYGWGNNSDG
jgi:alpha-tubulin suppressor-like RCC1 family protein